MHCSDNARCIATCNEKYVVESNSGGLTWSISYIDNNSTVLRGAYCDAEDFCIITGDHGVVFASTIINNWYNVGSNHHGGSDAVAVFNADTSETLMGAPWKSSDSANGLVVSSDGITWQEFENGTIRYVDFLVSNSFNHWVGANRTGSFYYSPNFVIGCNWKLVQTSPSSTNLQDLETTGNEFVATGYITDSMQVQHGITFYTTESH